MIIHLIGLHDCLINIYLMDHMIISLGTLVSIKDIEAFPTFWS